MQKRRHWWNGKWGLMTRRDIYLWEAEEAWQVEAREGGADGESRWWQAPDEDLALRLSHSLMDDSPDWKDMSRFLERT